MKQLTVRGFDDELSDAIRGLARREGISLNKAALRLLRKGAGLDDGSERRGKVGSSLDHLFGSWTQEQVDEMNEALEQFEKIDEDLWR